MVHILGYQLNKIKLNSIYNNIKFNINQFNLTLKIYSIHSKLPDNNISIINLFH